MTVGTDQRALDELCVNTIRTLSMDAVQQANSGHPGTPMALAPIAYLLYTRVMRHSPEQPDWPGRDRFVLSCGHASMLLYSTLHLAGYDVTHRADPALPPDRLALRRASGVRPRAGGRDDHRPARPGHRHRGRDGARRAHAGRALQPRRARAGRQLHLLHRVRRRHAGGGGVRGLVGRRPPRAREADRLLRRQPHLDRGRHRAGVLRGRRRALRGLRLARPEPARGPRARHAAGRGRGGPAGDRPAEPDRRAHAHRARLAQQAGHARRARRAARRGGDPPHQGGLRLPEPGAVLRPGRGARALPRLRRARARAAGRVAGALRRLPLGARRARLPSSSATRRARCPPASAPTCPGRARTPA